MNTEPQTPPAVVLSTAMLDGQERLYEHDGKAYTTQPATSCDRCVFYWRDGGIYDACGHPDQKLASVTCWASHRKAGTNIAWVLCSSNVGAKRAAEGGPLERPVMPPAPKREEL